MREESKERAARKLRFSGFLWPSSRPVGARRPKMRPAASSLQRFLNDLRRASKLSFDVDPNEAAEGADDAEGRGAARKGGRQFGASGRRTERRRRTAAKFRAQGHDEERAITLAAVELAPSKLKVKTEIRAIRRAVQVYGWPHL